MKAAATAMARTIEQIPNIGPSVDTDLRGIGVHAPKQLLGQDPYASYERVHRVTGVRHGPCLCDCFVAAVRFMEGGEAVPWWTLTAERKQRFAMAAEARS